MVFKKREEGYNVSDTGNWNVASDFSKLKIMKPLYNADTYSNIATFGSENLFEDRDIENYDGNRLLGFERLIECLIMVIDNSKFAVKTSKKDLEDYRSELIRIQKLVPQLYSIRQNQIRRTKELVIKEKDYKIMLNRLKELKSLINEPLNKNHLIYTDKEEFDPQEYKKSVFDLATNRG